MMRLKVVPRSDGLGREGEPEAKEPAESKMHEAMGGWTPTPEWWPAPLRRRGKGSLCFSFLTPIRGVDTFLCLVHFMYK